ncbi:MAG: class II histone deacetylase, partial [Proteobacteria bacterium]|nr:class II histone deacetylase [Pseudomonadota bacterium]
VPRRAGGSAQANRCFDRRRPALLDERGEERRVPIPDREEHVSGWPAHAHPLHPPGERCRSREQAHKASVPRADGEPPDGGPSVLPVLGQQRLLVHGVALDDQETVLPHAPAQPPHHARPQQSMGFCLLCNIPIAIEAAKAQHGLGKVAVVDWDVHHGNGTQAVYYDRGDVLTISLHQENCFPPGYSGAEDRGEGAGEGANINIPLPPGSGHDTYLRAMETIVIPALERFAPDLIVVASGLDANGLDPLARQLLHSDTFRAMARMVGEAADRLCGGKLVVVHEGGYSEAYVPFCGQAVVEAIMGATSDVVDPALEMIVAQQPSAATLAFQFDQVDRLARLFATPPIAVADQG